MFHFKFKFGFLYLYWMYFFFFFNYWFSTLATHNSFTKNFKKKYWCLRLTSDQTSKIKISLGGTQAWLWNIPGDFYVQPRLRITQPYKMKLIFFSPSGMANFSSTSYRIVYTFPADLFFRFDQLFYYFIEIYFTYLKIHLCKCI